jgi:hypothetical protein
MLQLVPVLGAQGVTLVGAATDAAALCVVVVFLGRRRFN